MTVRCVVLSVHARDPEYLQKYARESIMRSRRSSGRRSPKPRGSANAEKSDLFFKGDPMRLCRVSFLKTDRL